MNRVLAWVNFGGVLALAVLCAVQWTTNRAVQLEVRRLEQVRREQAARLEEQETAARAMSADLEDFRTRLAGSLQEVREAEEKAARFERESMELAAERDAYKARIEQWAEAVAARDAQLETLQAQLQQAAAARNEATQRFNELATRYNSVVEDLNTRTRELNAQRGTNATARSATNR